MLAGGTSVLFASCIKDDVKDLKDEGATFIKILESTENKFFFEPFTDIRSFSLFSLRKDAANSGELNTASTAKVKLSPTLISDYNTANGTDFEPLPDSLYTLDPSIVKAGTDYDMSFKAGDFAREFIIKLNGAKWNLAHKYALGFTISDAGGKKITSGKKDIIVLIAIKNKWDGIYEVTGSFADATNPAFVSAYPLEWELQTTSATQCKVVDNVNLGFPGYLFYTGTGYSYYGNFGLLVNFDPATDKITSVTNFYGQPASNTRSAELDPSGLNKYDAATKTINIKYFMKQPSVVATPPNIRSTFNETWKYIGPR